MKSFIPVLYNKESVSCVDSIRKASSSYDLRILFFWSDDF